MPWPEPTRVICLLAALLAGACQRPDPPAVISSPPTSAAGPASRAPSSDLSATGLAAAPSEGPPAPSTAPSASSPPLPAPPTSVLVLGDSLSNEAVGGGGYVKLLRERCPGVRFDNRSRGGFMVNQMRKRLEHDVLPLAPSYSHAIVFGGVNDLYSDLTANRTLPRIQTDLARIYSVLSERGVRVVAITVTPWSGFTRYHTPHRSQNTLRLNEWILAQQQAGKLHTAIDAYPLLSCGVPEQLCPELAAPFKDGLHFGKAGQQRLGEAVYAAAFSGCKANRSE